MTVSAYDVSEDGAENRILFWLRLDEWLLRDAAYLFADINPDSVTKNGLITLREVRYTHFDDTFEMLDLESKVDDLKRIFFDPVYQYDTPQKWIERALDKKIAIPWLDFAIETGFYNSETKEIQAEKPIFDKASTTYPMELDLALQAWQAVTSNSGKGKPKAQIRAWLDANTKLSVAAKKRISIVANWDRAGGATRTY